MNSDHMERYEHERSLPPLDEVLEQLEAGQLEYFLGPENRDGKRYRIVQLWGPDGETITGLHRIIAASALGRWVDRVHEVDHINRDPSDNRAENLEIVSPSVNRERRRQRLDVSNAVNPDKVRKRVSRRMQKARNQEAATKAAIDSYLAARNRYIEPSIRYATPPAPRSSSHPTLKPVAGTFVPYSQSRSVRRKVGVRSDDLEAKLRTVTSLEELNGMLNRRNICPQLCEWTEDEISLIESRRRFLEKQRNRSY